MSRISDLCVGLKEHIVRCLEPYGNLSRPIALLDFPDHGNVGDSAIWLGELAYFTTAFGRRPAYDCSARNDFDESALQQAAPEATIFLHGGGNFGDLWTQHHDFREHILERFPGRRVVQLPQTIQFNDAKALAKTARAIESHGNFILFVRDQRSLAIATSSFACPVHLAPDMALCMGALARPVPARHPLLVLLRDDIESNLRIGDHVGRLPSGSIMTDWLKDDRAFRYKKRLMKHLASCTELALSTVDRMRHRELRVANHARSRVDRGLRLLSSASFVITDRLHGHILCVLLGIPHIGFDNNYGKLGRFIDTWTKDCGLVQIVPSLDHALARWSDSQWKSS
jgi:exopolysaccharide biosynthesis predicted pyruvyltransferase EpsI